MLGVAVLSGFVSWLMGRSAADYADPYALSSRPSPAELGQYIIGVFGGSILVAIIRLVLGWYLTAIALQGLRGRPITMDWVAGAGLRAFAASLLLLGAWILSAIALGLLAVVTGGLGVLLLFVLLPVALFVAVRLLFWTLAIFDGAGVTEGASVS